MAQFVLRTTGQPIIIGMIITTYDDDHNGYDDFGNYDHQEDYDDLGNYDHEEDYDAPYLGGPCGKDYEAVTEKQGEFMFLEEFSLHFM